MNDVNTLSKNKTITVKDFSEVSNQFEEMINLLYSRLMPVVSYYIQLKNNNLKNFLFFIKRAPCSLELLPSIKFNYIRSHAIQRAKKSMKSYVETLCNKKESLNLLNKIIYFFLTQISMSIERKYFSLLFHHFSQCLRLSWR